MADQGGHDWEEDNGERGETQRWVCRRCGFDTILDPAAFDWSRNPCRGARQRGAMLTDAEKPITERAAREVMQSLLREHADGITFRHRTMPVVDAMADRQEQLRKAAQAVVDAAQRLHDMNNACMDTELGAVVERFSHSCTLSDLMGAVRRV